MSREYILNGAYVNETGTRSEIIAPGLYVSEIQTTVQQYAAFYTPQYDGRIVTQMIGY